MSSELAIRTAIFQAFLEFKVLFSQLSLRRCGICAKRFDVIGEKNMFSSKILYKRRLRGPFTFKALNAKLLKKLRG